MHKCKMQRGKRRRNIEMPEILNEQTGESQEYDEQLVRRLIEKIMIFDDKVTVEFKSSLRLISEDSMKLKLINLK